MKHQQMNREQKQAAIMSYRSRAVPKNSGIRQSPLMQHYSNIGNQAVLRMKEAEDEELMPKVTDSHQIQRQELLEEEELEIKPLIRMKPEEEEIFQAKQPGEKRSGQGVVSQAQIHSMRCPGKSLSRSTREFFEPRFGSDFSRVRVHTCCDAVQMNRELNAQAFTYGNNIFFNEGKYSPENSTGKHLLAHELTHVVQKEGTNVEEQVTQIIRGKPLEEEDEELLQVKGLPGSTQEITPGAETDINSLKGGGQPLSESTRLFFETHFGSDFSQVRIHNDSRAARIAQSINAKAFTIGKDIVFNNSEYSPDSSSGKRLLAHELTHVRQQDGKSRVIQCSNYYEINERYLNSRQATYRRRAPLTGGEETTEENVGGEVERSDMSSNSEQMPFYLNREKFLEISSQLGPGGFPVFLQLPAEAHSRDLEPTVLSEHQRAIIEEEARRRIFEQSWIDNFINQTTTEERNSYFVETISSILNEISPDFSNAFEELINEPPPNDWFEEINSLINDPPIEREKDTNFLNECLSIILDAASFYANSLLNKELDNLSEEEPDKEEDEERMMR